MAGALRQFDITLDDGLEDQLEMAFHLIVNLVGKAKARVVHRQQESLNLQFRVQLAFDNTDGVEQFADTLQCEILTLHGDDDGIGGCQRIHRNQSQGRGAVNEDIVIVITDRSQKLTDDILPVLQVEHLYLSTYKVDMAGDDV